MDAIVSSPAHGAAPGTDAERSFDAAHAPPDAAGPSRDAGRSDLDAPDAEPPADDCEALCRSLDDCDECLRDELDLCLDADECADVCRDHLPPEVAACVVEAAGDCDALEECW